MLLPQIPHAVEMSGLAMKVFLIHAWRAPVSGAKGVDETCRKLTIDLGTRADQYCSQARNYLSVAFNNGLRP
jgi:hypothetical protein